MSSIVPQLLLNGIIAGAIYALVASGFSLIYSVTKFMHFAHGAVLATGAYFLFLFSSILGWHPVISIVLTLIAACCVGLGMDWLVYRPLRNRKASSAVLLIASIALMILVNSTLLLIFGANVKTLPLAKYNPVYNFLTMRITTIQIIIILVALILLLFLWWLMKKTRLGKAMRAIADNKDVAQTVGINPENVYFATFLLGSFLAGIAGIMIGLEQNLFPQMGVSLIIKGFTGAVIGDISVVHGSVLGSFVLGIVENIGIWFLPSGYKDAIAFVLLFLFLLIRPQGLLGKKGRYV